MIQKSGLTKSDEDFIAQHEKELQSSNKSISFGGPDAKDNFTNASPKREKQVATMTKEQIAAIYELVEKGK